MNKKQCREALDIYKKFIDRTDRVSQYLKATEVMFEFSFGFPKERNHSYPHLLRLFRCRHLISIEPKFRIYIE